MDIPGDVHGRGDGIVTVRGHTSLIRAFQPRRLVRSKFLTVATGRSTLFSNYQMHYSGTVVATMDMVIVSGNGKCPSPTQPSYSGELH